MHILLYGVSNHLILIVKLNGYFQFFLVNSIACAITQKDARQIYTIEKSGGAPKVKNSIKIGLMMYLKLF
jgi:hypothetical protein